jgi:hypothetical protein
MYHLNSNSLDHLFEAAGRNGETRPPSVPAESNGIVVDDGSSVGVPGRVRDWRP